MLSELNAQTDRFRAPRRERQFDARALLEATDASSVSELWARLADRIYAIPISAVTEREYERACPGDLSRIAAAAHAAIERRVDLLGTGPIELGSPIDWHRDFKTGHTWPPAFMRDIDYTNLGRPSDVKVPWEISRLQWLIPVGQLYRLSGDERCAAASRAILEEWIESNPYAHSVNWACTMEVAMRIFTWTWLFHAFCRSEAWADEEFRGRFLRTLFLHGEFTQRYIERSDINGNHFTADAAGLVFAGLFFGRGTEPVRWAEEGWGLLCGELPLQVFEDGVDFEGSIAYHRLVFELFFLAARYREACGLPVPTPYRDRVVNMARFALKYTRPDGSSPLVGDADDARVLPFGGQAITDHHYVASLAGTHWHVPDLFRAFSGPRSEIFWTLGRRAAASLPDDVYRPAPVQSAAFPHGGFYVMRNERDHVFIDCGPVGQGGRGGHGHNDCLSFEAMLDGVQLVSDCGAYLYTANAIERNRFRSSAYHNTPQIDGAELNRFVSWDNLWTLHDDAAPEVRLWESDSKRDIFIGAHSGYQRLAPSATPVRTIALDHERHTLRIDDVIEGTGEHTVTIPLHLAPGVQVEQRSERQLLLKAGGKTFLLEWSSEVAWKLEIGRGRVSPSYGVVEPSVRLLWKCVAHAAALTMSLSSVAMEGQRAPRSERLVRSTV
jgi:uncharacterized heparinase superfamily protein